MHGNGTIISVGNATISVPASAALTGLLLASVKSALEGSVVNHPAPAGGPGTSRFPIIIPGPSAPGTNSVIIPDSDTGVIDLPGGYAFAVYQGNGSLFGGDAHTIVIGDLNYSGGAGTVLSTSSVASATNMVSDTQSGAVMSFATGTNTVTAAGTGQRVNLDAGSNVVLADHAGLSVMQAAGSSTINSSASTAGSSTVMATGGNVTFLGFGTGNDVASVSGANTTLLFLGEGGTDTIDGGAGADTVFAGAALYTGGTGTNLFVGGAGTSTLYGAAKETIYSGTGGGVWSLASNSSNFFDAAGGSASAMAADTVMLGAGSAGSAIVWSANNEHLTLGAPSGASGAVVVSYGNNNVIDMSKSAGGNTVVLWNIDLNATQPFTGNVTLTASDAGKDSFVLFGSLFSLPSAAAHTITIDNWQASDILDLSAGYSSAQAAAATAALASGSSFTLSDGTTVQFNGAKPSTIIHV
jgi:hypothetical protein